MNFEEKISGNIFIICNFQFSINFFSYFSFIGSKQSTVCFSKMTVKKFLSGIYMFRCMDIVQLLAASHQMFEFIKQHPKVNYCACFMDMLHL